MEEKNYNGWKNRQTWNVALWIENDECLYRSAVDFMKSYKGVKPYASFIKNMGLQYDKTPDNIKYISTRICYKELNNMMNEFKEA